ESGDYPRKHSVRQYHHFRSCAQKSINWLGSGDIGERNVSVGNRRIPQVRDSTSQTREECGIDPGKSIFVPRPLLIGDRGQRLSGSIQSRTRNKLTGRKIGIADRIDEIRSASGVKELRGITG